MKTRLCPAFFISFLLFIFFVGSAIAQSPGGVSAGLGIWLKADAGITLNGSTVSQWNDQSGNGRNEVQGTAASQATYMAGIINFNPALKFSGAQQYAATSVFTSSGTGNFKIFTAVTVDAANLGLLSEYTSNGYAIAFSPQHTDGNFYFDAPYGYRVAGTPSVNNTNLYSLSRTATLLSATNARKSMATPVAVGAAVAPNSSSFKLGIWGGFYNGKVGEVIVYNNAAAMTATQQLSIESYLGIKWGVTLDQTTATNYLASDASVLWNATTNATYKNRITGIGRDDASALNQKQSINQDTTSGGYVTMGLGAIAATNAANTNSFAADKSFELWGDDGVAGLAVTSVTGDGTTTLTSATCNSFARLAKTFKVAETGTVGNVQVQVNLRGVILGKTAADFYLAINNTATFAGTITKLIPASSYANGVVTFNVVDFTDGQYFTVIGTKVNGPAGIGAGLKLWMEAEDGITLNGTAVSQWDDQSINANSLKASNTTGIYNATGLNFNPTIKFPANNYFTKASGVSLFGTASYTGATSFSIVKSSAQIANIYYESLSTGTLYELLLPYNDGNIYDDLPYSARISTAAPNPSTYNQFNIWTAASQTSAQLFQQNGKTIVSGTSAAANYTGNNSTFYLGGPNQLNGYMSEVILYSQALTANQRQNINSYLGVKWGITIDQTTATNYQASDSSVIWNATANAAYKNRITGIGRDDCSVLNQKQSRNQDTSNYSPVIGLTYIDISNAANTSSFSANKSFELWGDDNGTINFSTAFTLIPPYTYRMTRVWTVQETGTIGTVRVAMAVSAFPANATVALITSSVNTFASGVVAIPTTGSLTINGINYYYFDVDFTNGQFFSFATTPPVLFEPCTGTNLLTNPSFESPVVTAGGGINTVGSLPGWTFSAGSSISLIRTPVGSSTTEPTFAADGLQYLTLGGSLGVMDQVFTLTSPAIVNYSGRFANINNATPSSANVAIQIYYVYGGTPTGGQPQGFYLSDEQILTDTSHFNWKTISGISSLLPAGTYDFRFLARSANVAFDDMSVCVASDAVTGCTNNRVMKNPGTWVATASDTYSASYPASHIIDGSLSATSWVGNPSNSSGTLGYYATPPYVTIDFGSSLNLAGFAYWPRIEVAEDMAFYTAQYSNDGINFTKIQDGSLQQQNENNGVTGQPILAYFTTGVTARYLRVLFTRSWQTGMQGAVLELLPIVCGTATLPDRSCLNANLMSTGTDATGTSKTASGLFDPSWEVAAVPANTAANYSSLSHITFVPAVVGNNIPGSWNASPFGNADWINYTPTSKDIDITGGGIATDYNDYFYRYKFNVSDPYLLAGFKLKLNFMADNSVYAVYINGVNQTGLTNVPQSASIPYSYAGFQLANQATTTLKNNWQFGVNELVVQVKSLPGASGFLGQNTSTCPGIDFGDAPASYNTSRATLGPGHVLELDGSGNVDLRLGALIDAEADGIPSFGVSDNMTGLNDEDGVSNFPVILGDGHPNIFNYSVTVSTYNNTGNTANLCGWIDWNGNGVFDAGEGQCTTVANGATSATLTWSSATLGGALGTTGTYARFRITTDALNSGTPTGPASNGEVEDYYIPFVVTLSTNLINFNAAKQNDDALLTWTASGTTSGRGFGIQRSTNGNDYINIGMVDAADSSSAMLNYSFTDFSPAAGTNYYRLKITNNDGSFSYSEIRVLNFGNGDEILIYPNPAKDILTITGIEPGLQLRVIGVDGRTLITKTAAGNTETLNVQSLAPGIYMVQVIKNGTLVMTQKFTRL